MNKSPIIGNCPTNLASLFRLIKQLFFWSAKIKYYLKLEKKIKSLLEKLCIDLYNLVQVDKHGVYFGAR